MGRNSGQMPEARRPACRQMPPGRLVDLSRYPITDLAPIWQAMRDARWSSVAGACVLENLLQPPVAEAAWPEVMP